LASRKVASTFWLTNQLQEHLLVAFASHWSPFSRPIAFTADYCVSRELGTCATQHWKGRKPLDKENSNRAAELVLGQFLAGFLAFLNLTKNEHDFVFRLWEESLGCVQTPPHKQIKVIACPSKVI